MASSTQTNLVTPKHSAPGIPSAVALRNPAAPFISGWRNRSLVGRLARREIEARYRGSLLGLLWSVLAPVLMLAVYTFVFTVVFPARWGVQIEGPSNFALLLFCGLILFNLFAECLNRAPALMLMNTSYIKKVVFPLEILPWVTIVVALFNAAMSYAVLFFAYFVVLGAPPLTALLLPLIISPIVLFSLGLTLFFSSIGVFLRDLQQVMGLITMVLMFLSPLFYPLSALPDRARLLVSLSPLSIAIEESRRILFFGELPNFGVWLTYFGAAWLITWLGFVWFMKTKKGFADVL